MITVKYRITHTHLATRLNKLCDADWRIKLHISNGLYKYVGINYSHANGDIISGVNFAVTLLLVHPAKLHSLAIIITVIIIVVIIMTFIIVVVIIVIIMTVIIVIIMTVIIVVVIMTYCYYHHRCCCCCWGKNVALPVFCVLLCSMC